MAAIANRVVQRGRLIDAEHHDWDGCHEERDDTGGREVAIPAVARDVGRRGRGRPEHQARDVQHDPAERHRDEQHEKPMVTH